jgi:toxin ParE1/3/4
VLWLRAEADSATATKFSSAVIRSFEKIAETPGLGPRVASTQPSLAGLRKWRIDGFPKMLVFHTISTQGVRVTRVLNAAQDWWSLLDLDEDRP